MAKKYIIQHRRGTASQWAEKNTIIPKEGELVIEIDEESSLHKLKIGDGIHAYAELAYLQAGDEVVTQVLAKTLPRIITINLNKDAWEPVQYQGNPNTTCYKQIIPIDGVTSRTKLNLQPDAIMLAEFQKLNLVFVAENEIDGATNENEITVYSIGDIPLDSYTMQATIVEAELLEETNKVVGIPVGTPVAQSDWAQSDETKGDFIKNKPTFSRVITGSYVGEGSTAPRYIPLAENVKAVLLATGGGYLPLTLLATDNPHLSNHAYLSYAGDIVNLAVLDNADVINVTYTYVAFVN
jgi:hypothetical protein